MKKDNQGSGFLCGFPIQGCNTNMSTKLLKIRSYSLQKSSLLLLDMFQSSLTTLTLTWNDEGGSVEKVRGGHGSTLSTSRYIPHCRDSGTIISFPLQENLADAAHKLQVEAKALREELCEE